MKKSRAIITLLILALLLGCFGYTAAVGIGSNGSGSAASINLGLDLEGGVSITYQAVGDETPSKEDMADTIYKLQKRVEGYSTEAVVYQEGDDRINIEIPGVSDANAILEELGKPGSLYFIKETAADGTQNYEPYSRTMYKSIETLEEEGSIVLVGTDVKDAQARSYQDSMQNTQICVELTLTDEGAVKFAEATSEAYSKGETIAIYYDNAIVSAPSVNSVISDGMAQITGGFDVEEANQLASTIRIGGLKIQLEELHSKIVGAQLGEEAISTSVKAALVGFILIVVFMIAVYYVSGLAASLALGLYVELMIILLDAFDITLTLPGIAGIILSIGMAVDGNIIIFARIKEELKAGKTVRSAIKLGYGRATSAIIDGNVTTLIAAVVLYLRGSGTIKGFAVTLAIGIVLSVISSLLICRFIMLAAYNLGFDKEKYYGKLKDVKIYNFTKHWLKYLIISGILIGAGFVGLIVGKATTGNILNYGLDFVGGTSVEVYFDEMPPSNSEIEEVVGDILGSTPQIVQVDGENAVIIKTDIMIRQEGGSSEDSASKATADGSGSDLSSEENSAISDLKAKLLETYGITSDKIRVESISASVSDEMKLDAIWAVVISGVCMLLYIWIRFKNLSFAASSVLALLHDVLVVFMVYAVFRVTVDNSFIACMLTIVGYSINATIVIFDRIRENLKIRTKKQTVEDVVNLSISETLTRSINTSITTLISVVMIVILGVDSIREFAIPLMVGIICGAYSSVCIAGTFWLFLSRRSKKDGGDAS